MKDSQSETIHGELSRLLPLFSSLSGASHLVTFNEEPRCTIYRLIGNVLSLMDSDSTIPDANPSGVELILAAAARIVTRESKESIESRLNTHRTNYSIRRFIDTDKLIDQLADEIYRVSRMCSTEVV